MVANENAANLPDGRSGRVQAGLAFNWAHGRLEIVLDAQLLDQL